MNINMEDIKSVIIDLIDDNKENWSYHFMMKADMMRAIQMGIMTD